MIPRRMMNHTVVRRRLVESTGATQISATGEIIPAWSSIGQNPVAAQSILACVQPVSEGQQKQQEGLVSETQIVVYCDHYQYVPSSYNQMNSQPSYGGIAQSVQTDVLVGDKLVMEDGREMRVLGVEDDGGVMDHLIIKCKWMSPSGD